MSHHYHPPPRRKRKDREYFYPPPPPTPPPPVASKGVAPPSKTAAEMVSSNRLLAGYMAHEFLTKGTLLGKKFDSARAESALLLTESALSRRGKVQTFTLKEKLAEPKKKLKPDNEKSYAEVASLLKEEGTHIPGIVNPTQLGQWIQM